MPLASDQVQLVQAMARALAGVSKPSLQSSSEAARPDAAQPDVQQFRWPIHTNQQLDLGEEAARAALAGFIGRRLEQQQCRGLVLLGEACRTRVPLEQMGVPAASHGQYGRNAGDSTVKTAGLAGFVDPCIISGWPSPMMYPAW